MPLRNLGKLFKSKKNDKSGSEEIDLPLEGYEQCIRLLLAYAGRDVSDLNRIVKTPGETPVCGTAVLRYLGRSHGLVGADAFEDLEIDHVVDLFQDIIQKIFAVEKEEDSNIRDKRVSELKIEVLEGMAKFDALVANNDGYLALHKRTWADFLVAGMWDHVQEFLQADCGARFPNIGRMVESIVSAPAVRLALQINGDVKLAA